MGKGGGGHICYCGLSCLRFDLFVCLSGLFLFFWQILQQFPHLIANNSLLSMAGPSHVHFLWLLMFWLIYIFTSSFIIEAFCCCHLAQVWRHALCVKIYICLNSWASCFFTLMYYVKLTGCFRVCPTHVSLFLLFAITQLPVFFKPSCMLCVVVFVC